MNKFVLRQSLLLLLTATIWGVAFVAQSVGMDYVGPFTFNAVRCLIGGVVLLPCIAILNKFNRKNGVECMEDETDLLPSPPKKFRNESADFFRWTGEEISLTPP